MDPADLAFKARALAQAHPLTSLAKRFQNRTVEQQSATQPMPESGHWAGVALLNGYCVRRVEEEQAGVTVETLPADAALDVLEAQVGAIAEDLRSGDPERHLLLEPDLIFPALDRIIASEVDRRANNWRDEVDATVITELEGYVTWWAVIGYALRVTEARQVAGVNVLGASAVDGA